MIKLHYKPEYFVIQELVPRAVYEERGEKAWYLLNPELLKSLDIIRKHCGPVTINNWHTGGNRQWSGLRTEFSPYGTMYSQHRFGNAADCLVKDVKAAREWIIEDGNTGVRGLELTVSWLHVDVRNYDGLMLF